MFRRKNNENDIDVKKGIELVKEANQSLIILNEKRGYIEGDNKYIYSSAMNLISLLIENNILDVSDIVRNFADCDEHIVKICADDEEDAFKQLDKEVKKMKNTISKKLKEKENK